MSEKPNIKKCQKHFVVKIKHGMFWTFGSYYQKNVKIIISKYAKKIKYENVKNFLSSKVVKKLFRLLCHCQQNKYKKKN